MKKLFILFFNAGKDVINSNKDLINGSDIPLQFDLSIEVVEKNPLDNLNNLLFDFNGWIFFTIGNEYISPYLTNKFTSILYGSDSDVITIPKAIFKDGNWINKKEPNYQTRICKMKDKFEFKNSSNPTLYNYKSETILQEREYSLYEIR